MESLPREILFLILESVSIGDSVNLFSTCRYFMGLGLTFLESYLGDTEEARLVADEELTVIGAITRTLGLDKSIKRGRPYSIQPISSEIGNQVMCYDNLICFLQRGYICISNNCGASEYAINIREITSLADPTEQIDENDEEILVALCDFNYHKLTVVLIPTRRFVCIELKGDGSWQIVYIRPERIPTMFTFDTISSASVVFGMMQNPFLHFEWFDFEKRRTFIFNIDGRGGPNSVVKVVSSGPNVYILLSYDNFFEAGAIRLAESGLEYEPADTYLISPHIYADRKDGVTVFTPTYIGNSLIFQPNDDKPGFPRLSRAYFQICGNDILQNVGYEDSTGARKIGTARVANQKNSYICALLGPPG
ncbi:hypothetical protein BJX96DRAFT_181385 [Aspergillus floccosus]